MAIGLLQDFLGLGKDAINELQLSPVLLQRIELANDKYEAAIREVEQSKQEIADLKRENERLRAQIPQAEFTLKPDTIRVLVYMFEATEMDDREVTLMASRLGMTQGVLQYHLDRLRAARFAHESGADIDGVYWALTPDDRMCVMESVSQQMLRWCAMEMLRRFAMTR